MNYGAGRVDPGLVSGLQPIDSIEHVLEWELDRIPARVYWTQYQSFKNNSYHLGTARGLYIGQKFA